MPNITVQKLNGESISVKLDPGSTVAELAQHIARKLGIPIPQQMIYLADQEDQLAHHVELENRVYQLVIDASPPPLSSFLRMLKSYHSQSESIGSAFRHLVTDDTHIFYDMIKHCGLYFDKTSGQRGGTLITDFWVLQSNHGKGRKMYQWQGPDALNPELSDSKISLFKQKITAIIGQLGTSNRINMMLLEAGVSLKPLSSYCKQSLFLYAIKNRHEKGAEILLQQYGAYPDWEGDSHYTPLTIAAGNGHLDMVELLLNNRAGPSRYDDVGYKSPLIVAARNGHLDVVDLLLRRGADIDYANIYRKTALMYAAQKGHIKIVKKLLEKGADPRMTDSWGYDAVDYARKPEVRKVIEEHMRDHGQTREKSCLKSILSIIGGWIQWMFDCSSSHRQAPELPGISGGTGPLPEVDQMPSVANQQTVENASMIQTQKSCCPSPYSG